MKKDRELNPERLLGKFLWIRDLVHLSRYEIQQNNGQHTQKVIDYCLEAGEYFRKDFLNSYSMYQPEALQFYSESLRMLGEGLEFQFNISAGKDIPKKEVQDNLGRFQDSDEFFAYLKSRYSEVSEPFEGEFL